MLDNEPTQKLGALALIQKLGGNTTVCELEEAIAQCAKAVGANGGSGKVTLEIAIKDVGSNQVQITDTVKITAPKASRPMMLAYVTQDGFLTESDPMQGKLKFEVGQRG